MTAGSLNQQADKHGVLKAVFGLDSFRPNQEAVIDSILAGHHTLAVMPTGAGKSLCYQLPAVLGGGLTVVVSPLVALMDDQVGALGLAGVAAEAIHSGRGREQNVAVWRRVAAGSVSLLYLSPERLMTAPMLRALAKLPLALFAIDESHCVSQWGHDFRPEYAALSRLTGLFPGIPIAAFTATADATTRDEIVAKLMDGRARVFVSGFDRPNLRLAITPKANWKRQLMDFLSGRAGQSGIVYCLSRKKTEEVAALLRDRGFAAIAYHAGLDGAARLERQNRFVSESGLIMAATIAFGMGIDKPDVRFVVHVDLPSSVESYYQEIGRAGRDGAPAETLLLHGLADNALRRRFIDQGGAGDQQKRIEHRKLSALLSLCETAVCRRRVLLGYFGETPTGDCGNCDNCLEPVDTVDGTAAATRALAVIAATGQIFGAQHIIDCLRGKRNAKVEAKGHHRLASFGAGADRSANAWRSIIRQMTAGGLLGFDVGGHGSLVITALGREVAAGRETFSHRPETHRAKVPRRKPGAGGAEDSGDYDDLLLDRLKRRRLALAREREVPAYVIFHDRSLRDMAAKLPATAAEMADIHGVGQGKLETFGQIMLVEIAAHLAERGSCARGAKSSPRLKPGTDQSISRGK